MKLLNSDCLEVMKSMADNSIDILCTDPPYALGSEVIIKSNGKPDYKKAVDFMNKWEMPSGDFWEQWFKEAFRILKFGSHCLVFGMDRQLLMFKYYASLGGFSESQSLYWYFISNFPKATDLGKMLDKQAGVEREVVGEKTAGMGSGKTFGMLQSDGFNSNKEMNSGIVNITAPASELAKKYDGFKYSVAPLKQTCETIMVFKKPYKTGSCLHDVLAYEAGDKTITVGAVDIDGNRVATSETWTGKDNIQDTGAVFKGALNTSSHELGRYPSQTYVDDGTAEVLDKQSGSLTSGACKSNNISGGVFGSGKCVINEFLGSKGGGSSKILHKIKYDTVDLFIYEPKVSSGERNEGCDGLEKKEYMSDVDVTNRTLIREDGSLTLAGRSIRPQSENTHPTVKPIDLMVKILKLFKTPDKQLVLDCFMGSGSTGVACKQLDLDFIGVEISKEYFEIATTRINNIVVQSELF